MFPTVSIDLMWYTILCIGFGVFIGMFVGNVFGAKYS